MAACMNAHRDKKDPAAYCATIMRATEGGMKKKHAKKGMMKKKEMMMK